MVVERLHTFTFDYVGAFNAIFYALFIPVLIGGLVAAQERSSDLAYAVAAVAMFALGSFILASQSILGRGRMRRLLGHRYLPFVVTYFVTNSVFLVIAIVYVTTKHSPPSEQYPAIAAALAVCTTIVLTFGATVAFQNLREVQSKADREVRPVLVDEQVEFQSIGTGSVTRGWSLRCRNVGPGSAVVVVVERDGVSAEERSVVTRDQHFQLGIAFDEDTHTPEENLLPENWRLRVWCRAVATGQHQAFEIVGSRHDVGTFGFAEANWTLDDDGRDQNGRLVNPDHARR